jgi:putative intracellular protease/amidase
MKDLAGWPVRSVSRREALGELSFPAHGLCVLRTATRGDEGCGGLARGKNTLECCRSSLVRPTRTVWANRLPIVESQEPRQRQNQRPCLGARNTLWAMSIVLPWPDIVHRTPWLLTIATRAEGVAREYGVPVDFLVFSIAALEAPGVAEAWAAVGLHPQDSRDGSFFTAGYNARIDEVESAQPLRFRLGSPPTHLGSQVVELLGQLVAESTDPEPAHLAVAMIINVHGQGDVTPESARKQLGLRPGPRVAPSEIPGEWTPLPLESPPCLVLSGGVGLTEILHAVGPVLELERSRLRIGILEPEGPKPLGGEERAKYALVLPRTRSEAAAFAVDALDAIDLVWLPGGHPEEYVEIVAGTPLEAALVRFHDRGGLVVACSAGAILLGSSRTSAWFSQATPERLQMLDWLGDIEVKPHHHDDGTPLGPNVLGVAQMGALLIRGGAAHVLMEQRGLRHAIPERLALHD